MDVKTLLGKIATLVINPAITLGFIVATIIVFYGIAQLILKADEDTKREEYKQWVIWGVVGMAIMFSVYGILRLVLATFNIPISFF